MKDLRRMDSSRFDSVTLPLGIEVPNREHDARREGAVCVSRGDAVRLLPAGGSSRRVGKPGYGRPVETQAKNRRPTMTVRLTAAGYDRPSGSRFRNTYFFQTTLRNFDVFWGRYRQVTRWQ